ncbi:MAG: stage II sporulation protein P [Lachnospiraceae bacterium]|nr:stage II sporulation protein P [Lachnospiraceae bacterium]
MRRRQKEKWKKIFVLACGTVVLIFGLRALGGLARSLWQQLVPRDAPLIRQIGERFLLNDRALFSYLRFHEEERGPFRFISEHILSHSRYVIAKEEGDEKKVISGNEEDWEGNFLNKTESKLEVGEMTEDRGEEGEGEEGKKEDIGENIAGGMDWQETGEGKKDGEFSVSVTEGLLESVMSENAAYGNYLPVSYAKGEVIPATVPPLTEEVIPEKSGIAAKLLIENNYSMPKLADPDYLISTYYIVDSVTSTLPELFDGEALLSKNLAIDPVPEGGYQILIYHTHASEAYVDSKSGEVMDTVRGPGEALAEYLRGYGYTVYHDMTAYDQKDGKDNRNQAYSTARPQIEAFLEEHPEVLVVIDLHRDGGAKRVATVNGKKTAQVMLFNGLCRNASGPIDYLDNENLVGNLAFSLQTNLVGRVLYPNLMFRIYLKNYRYNQHFRERCMLIELGTDQNTVEEAYNAIEPLAHVLDTVLRGE